MASDDKLPLWVFGIFIVIIYSPVVWVRRLEPFKKGFMLAMGIIVLAVITTSWYAFDVISEQNDGGAGPGYEPINTDYFWSMVGFAFYLFEGIGCLLPILREAEHPETFSFLVMAAQWTIISVQIFFGSVCYYAWGTSLTESVVTEMLPAGNVFVQVMKLLYCISLIYSYKVNIVPTFSALESFILGVKETKKNEDEISGDERSEGQESTSLYWKVNILRSSVVCLTVVAVILVANKLDKFYAVSGAVLGMTNVLLLPSICHYRLKAEDRC